MAYTVIQVRIQVIQPNGLNLSSYFFIKHRLKAEKSISAANLLSTSVGFCPVDVSCYLPLDIYISFHPHSDFLFFQEANDIVRVLFFNSKYKLFRKYVCQEVAIESRVQFIWKDSRERKAINRASVSPGSTLI